MFVYRTLSLIAIMTLALVVVQSQPATHSSDHYDDSSQSAGDSISEFSLAGGDRNGSHVSLSLEKI
jgi:hypothetical protein